MCVCVKKILNENWQCKTDDFSWLSHKVNSVRLNTLVHRHFRTGGIAFMLWNKWVASYFMVNWLLMLIFYDLSILFHLLKCILLTAIYVDSSILCSIIWFNVNDGIWWVCVCSFVFVSHFLFVLLLSIWWVYISILPDYSTTKFAWLCLLMCVCTWWDVRIRMLHIRTLTFHQWSYFLPLHVWVNVYMCLCVCV